MESSFKKLIVVLLPHKDKIWQQWFGFGSALACFHVQDEDDPSEHFHD